MRKFFAVTALLACSQLHAQRDTLDNVTVTATKYSAKTTETGKVVVTINRQQLEKAGSRDLSQVITELGGVFINGYSATPGKEKNVYLRGGKVDYTLITIDGVPVYDASGIGSNFDLRNLSVDNVERIEILKGSQSSLYGSDAVAGVVNIITRKGGSKTVGGSAVLSYGSYNTWRGSANLNGAAKGFDYNLRYAHFSSKGFSEAAPPAGSNAAFAPNGYRQNSVQANFGIQPSAKIRLQPFFRYGTNKAALDNGPFIDERDYNATTKNLQTGLRGQIAAGKTALTAVYQFNKTNRDYLDDSVLSRNGFYKYAQSAYKAGEHFAEAFAVTPLARTLRLTAGVDFRTSNTDYNATQISAFGTNKASRSGDSVKQSQTGVYAALNVNQQNFSVEGGGRFNHHSTYGDNFAFNFNPSYFLKRRVKIFANVSTGYKTPSLYQLFSEYGNKTLKPERSLNLEGGAQVLSADGKASLRATYFNRRIKDVIAFISIPRAPYAQYINQDEQRDHGLELDGSLALSDKVQAKSFYTWVDGKVRTKQAGRDTSFFNLYRRPASTLNLSVGVQATKALYVSANLNAVGRRTDPTFPPPAYRQVNLELRPYTLVNFYAEYGVAKNRLKFFADVRNLFDESYTDIYGYNTARFNAYGGVRFRF